MSVIDITNQKFGRWTVISRAENTVQGQARWLCRCECGNERVLKSIVIRRVRSASCGCLQREQTIARSTKHGHSTSKKVSPTYWSWCAMKARCTNPKNRDYPRYGGRGITVCKRWFDSFQNFLADMGEKPKGTSLDRIDNDKGYSPDNCRWASNTQQARNKSNNRLITFQGETLALAEWAQRLGITHDSLTERLQKWTLEKALTQTKTKQSDYGHCHKLTFKGETLTISEWSRKLGITTRILYRRFHKGLPVEKILVN